MGFVALVPEKSDVVCVRVCVRDDHVPTSCTCITSRKGTLARCGPSYLLSVCAYIWMRLCWARARVDKWHTNGSGNNIQHTDSHRNDSQMRVSGVPTVPFERHSDTIIICIPRCAGTRVFVCASNAHNALNLYYMCVCVRVCVYEVRIT